MALKNPAAEEWKPGLRYLGTVEDLVSQSHTPVGWLRRLIEGSNLLFNDEQCFLRFTECTGSEFYFNL
ncbi:MAG: hypothetical protein HQ551_12020 [Desulfobacteraceae bacterium]|nr:hypothetical protein [Desulfobacteraceae bacterium]